MARYRLVTLTRAVPGREDEFNDWYDNHHLPQLLGLPGFRSAQRFRLARSLDPDPPPPWLAIYEIDTDDIDAVLGSLRDAAGSGLLTISDSYIRDPDQRVAAVFEEVGQLVRAPARPDERG